MGLNMTYQFTDRLSFSGSFNYMYLISRREGLTGFFGQNLMIQFTMWRG